MSYPRIALNEPVLFLDDHWVARHTYLWRRIHSPRRVGLGPVLRPEEPWEGTCCIARNATFDPHRQLFRLWYQTWAPSRPSPESTYLCYAESADGFRWNKPRLGRVPFRGSTDNNIVVGNLGGTGPGSGGFDTPNVVEDPADPDPARRFKLLLFGWPTGREGYLVGFSADGLDWTLRSEPVQSKERVWDTNTLLIDRDQPRPFIHFNRHARMYEVEHRRCIYRSESEDFVHWTEPSLCLAPDLADEPGLQYYSMAVFRRASLYIGLLQVLHRSPTNPNEDRLSVRLAVSRDCRQWRPVEPRRPFFEPGPAGSFDSQWVYLNPPVSRDPDGPLLFFYDGRRHSHGEMFPSGAVGAAALRPDGFCSVDGGLEVEGLLETVPFLWPGGEFQVNALTQHGGSLRVEVLAVEGAGSTMARSRRLEGGLPRGPAYGPLAWEQPPSSEWTGRPVRVRFGLRGAGLFAFRFTPEPAGSLS